MAPHGRAPRRWRALVALLLLSLAALAHAQPPAATGPVAAERHPVSLYYFWGDGCPVCAQQKLFLDALVERYPEVTVHAVEVWYDADNLELLRAFSAAFSRPVTGVPVTFVGDDAWIGFNPVIGQQIDASVDAYRRYRAPDAADRLDAERRAQLQGAVAPAPEAPAVDPATVPGAAAVSLPFVGVVDLDGQPLLLATLLIAFVDGFNPCSLWVLALLLGVVINTRSRRKVLLVGVTFLVITAGVYGLFIAGLFSVFSYVAFLPWIRVAVALLALGFALVNLKDYVAYRRGISLTIGDEHKPGIYARIRAVMQRRDSFAGTMAATAGLALGVTLVELPCTAGLPVIWTNLLAGAGVEGGTFGALLGVYMLVYLLDELLVFGVVVVTMRIARFEEREGRLLKLVGGSVMLALAIAMLWLPHLLESIAGMLLLFGVAIGGALLVAVVHRWVHPASSPLAQGRRGGRARGR